MVEHDLAKVGVAGSNPVFRSTKKAGLQAGFFYALFLGNPYLSSMFKRNPVRWMACALAVGLSGFLSAQEAAYPQALVPILGTNAAPEGQMRLHALSYLRNTEYFNPIEEGQTWFGTQVAVQRAWKVAPKLTFRGGAFLNHTYGGKTTLAPVLQMRYETAHLNPSRNWYWLAGTLDGAASHGLAEPLYDLSRTLENPLEYGLQATKRKGRWRSDQWISWQKAIVYAEPAFERIWAGTAQTFDLWSSDGKRLSAIAQGLWSHVGGQIDASPVGTPEGNRLNGAVGAVATGGWVEGWALRVGYADPLQRFSPIQTGFGNLLHVHTKWQVHPKYTLRTGATYWDAENYAAPGGGYLFQSVNRYDPQVYQPERRLLFARLWLDRVEESHRLSLRLDPVWDFNAKTWEWGFALYWHMQLTP